MDTNIELIEVFSDLGAGIHGAGFGSSALHKVARSMESLFFSTLLSKSRYLPDHFGLNSYGTSYAKHIEEVVYVCKSVCNEVYNTIKRGNYPVLISGDHSSSAGTIAGIKMAKPKSVIGAIWIDAHADLHSPYTTPSGNMHGMPLAASIAEDNLQCAKRVIEPATMYFWEKFKNLGNVSPKILPQHIIYVSLRDFEEEESQLMNKFGIKNFDTQTLGFIGVENLVTNIFELLKNCTDVYVSFDVDCIDPTVSRGTGLPVDGGLFPRDAELLTCLLLDNTKVSCFEVTEYNPFLDINKETGGIVYNIIEKGIAAIMRRLSIIKYNYSDHIKMSSL